MPGRNRQQSEEELLRRTEKAGRMKENRQKRKGASAVERERVETENQRVQEEERKLIPYLTQFETQYSPVPIPERMMDESFRVNGSDIANRLKASEIPGASEVWYRLGQVDPRFRGYYTGKVPFDDASDMKTLTRIQGEPSPFYEKLVSTGLVGKLEVGLAITTQYGGNVRVQRFDPDNGFFYTDDITLLEDSLNLPHSGLFAFVRTGKYDRDRSVSLSAKGFYAPIKEAVGRRELLVWSNVGTLIGEFPPYIDAVVSEVRYKDLQIYDHGKVIITGPDVRRTLGYVTVGSPPSMWQGRIDTAEQMAERLGIEHERIIHFYDVIHNIYSGAFHANPLREIVLNGLFGVLSRSVIGLRGDSLSLDFERSKVSPYYKYG